MGMASHTLDALGEAGGYVSHILLCFLYQKHVSAYGFGMPRPVAVVFSVPRKNHSHQHSICANASFMFFEVLHGSDA